MAYIYTDTENRLILGNEEYVRQMNFNGAMWNKLRIVVRLCWQSTGSSILNTSFAVGLCEGTTNTFRSANTTGYVGVGWQTNSGMTYYSGPPAFYNNANNTLEILRRVGNTTSVTTCNTDYTYWRTSPTCTFYWIDFTRTGGNGLNIGVVKPNNSATSEEIDRYEFLYWAQQELSCPATYSSNYFPYFSGNQGVTTYTGNDINALDTVSISWNKATPPVEIADVLVLRFA